jgi:hypothetical protein
MTLEPLDGSSVARWADVLVPARQIAEVIAATEFVPKAMRDRPDAVTACVLYGDEIGVGPMQALQSIHVVEGRPAPSAELMRALIFRAGHTIAIHEMSGTRCRVSGLRSGRPEGERVVVEWTADMARAAGLSGKAVWQRYPRAMLLARATSDLARMVFPDVVKGLGYIAEDATNAAELDGWAPMTAAGEPAPEPEPVKPARKTVQRRTKPRVQELDGPAHERPGVPTPAEAPTPGHPGTASPGVGAVPPAGPDYPAQPDPIDLPVQARQSSRHVEPKSDAPPLDGAPEQEATPEVHHGSSGVAAPTLPPLEPEKPPEEPVKGPVPISDGFRRGMLGAWRKVAPVEPNAELNRMRRLEAWSDIVGREVTTSTDLTRDEGWRIAQAINRVEDGDAVVVEQADGWLRVRDWPAVAPTEPPDDDPELPL